MKMFELPTIMINFKTYTQASGKDAQKLCSICEEEMATSKVSISCCVQTADICRCSQTTDNTAVLAQHLDVEKAGGHTGKNHVKALSENGAIGSLINHSEDRVSMETIEKGIKILDEHDMLSIVCVKDADEAKTVAAYKPDIIAIEPPTLIGGDVSVTTADPSVITETIERVHEIDTNIPILCGAGVKTHDDVRKALELGAKGVLIASGVAKADDKKQAIRNLAAGMQ